MILIVDDDPSFLETAREILNRTRQVFLASHSRQAFNLAKDLGFSVVLVDLDLKGQEGIALIRKIRANVPGLPIIAISGVFQEHVLESARTLGAAETLRKPIDSEWNAALSRLQPGNRAA